MGILSRFKDIMAANINAALDKVEDPEKMVDQYLRDLNSELGSVKAETAAVMAEETRAKRAYEEALEEADKYQKYAEKAVRAGNDADARVFLQQKSTAASKVQGLKNAYEQASANATKMRQMHDKLTSDIRELNAKKEAIKAKGAVAKTQEHINQIGSTVSTSANRQSAMQKLDELEDRIDKRLDTANAMAELNESSKEPSLDDLKMKYDLKSDAYSDVDDELAALKKQMGQEQN